MKGFFLPLSLFIISLKHRLSFVSTAETSSTLSPIDDVPAFYVGCFNDNLTDRDLDATGLITNKNYGGTVESCIKFCIDFGKTQGLTNGYDYAGMQNRVECYCGQKYGKHGPAQANACNLACPSNQFVICGGKDANSVWEINHNYA